MNYVENYTGFSKRANKQFGNFLVLKLSATRGATITTKVINGNSLDATVTDGYCVYRITDPKNQKIQVTATKRDKVVQKEYSLAELVCQEDPKNLLDNLSKTILDSDGDALKGSE